MINKGTSRYLFPRGGGGRGRSMFGQNHMILIGMEGNHLSLKEYERVKGREVVE